MPNPKRPARSGKKAADEESSTVTETEEGFMFTCPLNVFGEPAKEDSPVSRCGFESTGWPTEEIAVKRGLQHLDEHKSGEPMQETGEFLLDNPVDGRGD